MSDTTSTAPTETPLTPAEVVAAAPAAEATPPPAAEPPKPAKPAPDAWAKHAAEEKRLRKVAEKVEADRKALEVERKAVAELETLKASAKAGDPEAIDRLVREFGVDYDALTRYQLRGRKVDPQEKLAREVEALKAERQREREEAQQRAEAEAWEATASSFRAHVLKESPDDYPMLAGEIEAEPDYIDSVLRSIEKHARESGQPTTIRDAALKLERYFREQTERRAARLKPAAPMAAAPAASPETSSDTKARPRDQQTGRFAGGDGPRRLTNDLSAERSAPPKGRDPSRPLTQRERDIEERERLRRAANALR